MTLNADELRALLELAAKPDNLRAHGFLRTAELLEALPILLAERDALKARVGRLERALRPFAAAAEYWKAFNDFQRITALYQHGDCLEVCHLRAARAALKGDEQ